MSAEGPWGQAEPIQNAPVRQTAMKARRPLIQAARRSRWKLSTRRGSGATFLEDVAPVLQRAG